MGALFGFLRTMLRLPAGWLLWIAALMTVNGLAPLFFLPSVEALATLTALALGAGIQTALFARLGFVRLLGAGHVPWLILVPWIWGRMDALPTSEPAYAWMAALVALNAISVVIDVADVTRYVAGERTPTVTLEDCEPLTQG